MRDDALSPTRIVVAARLSWGQNIIRGEDRPAGESRRGRYAQGIGLNRGAADAALEVTEINLVNVLVPVEVAAGAVSCRP